MNIDSLQQLKAILPWLYLYLGLSVFIVLCVDITRRFYNVRHLLNQKTVVLELTPPAFTRKSPVATEHLFSVLHALGNSRSRREKLLGRNRVFSLEVVSSRSQGIRYLIRLAEIDAAVFQQQLAAYLPDVRFKVVEDYLSPALEGERLIRLMEFKQAKHFAYPLANHASLIEHDPIAYITGSMTKLATEECIALQIVLSPSSPREARNIRNKLLIGKEPGLSGRTSRLPFRFLGLLLRLAVEFLRAILEAIGEMTRSSYDTGKQYPQPAHAAAVPTPAAQAVLDSLHGKLSQSLFQASIRALVITDDQNRASQNVKGLGAALASFTVPGYQGLIASRNFPKSLKAKYRLYGFTHRLPALLGSNSNVLAVSEVAAIYHFPYAETAQTENVIKSLSRTLPAPISLKNGTEFDVILGRNNHHGSTTDIGLTAAERERHVYIIGGTGNGKTTMLLYAMVQDVKNGKGIAVIDPHGDLAETILKYIPQDRIDDVIYFNPDDYGYPIGLNLLELPEGLSGDELLREKDLITETVVSVFRKIFSDDDSGGHRIEYVLRNAIQTALTIDGANIFTVFRLLTNAKYRKSVVKTLDDLDLKDFWNNELGKAGEFQRVKMSAGITAKIGRFLFSASAKRILEQPKSTIDFDDIINSGKILVCNFSKGLLGEDTSALFGITVLAKIQIATLRRARLQQTERQPFYLYADEFQNFATMSFVQLLSEARKYKLFLLMAEQSTSQQQEQRMVNIILANVGTVVCFRSGNPADEKLLLPMFAPYIETGEIAYLPSFHFYMRIAAINSQEPLSGETLLLDNPGSTETAKLVINRSRAKHGAQIEEVSKAIDTPDLIPTQNTVVHGVGLPD
jgi:hypothetical protein